MQITSGKKASTLYLNNLAKQNMKKNKRNYFIYFLTLVFSIALFYMFNSIGSQFEMLGIEDTLSYLPFAIGMMMVISVFTSLLTAFLIVYSNRLIILKRKKEFGIYLSLGMGRKEVTKLISRENRQIGFFALVVGIGLGFFLSQALALITGKVIGIGSVSFQFILSPVALIFTVLLIVLVLFIAQMYNKKQLKSLTILELLHAEEKNEKIAQVSKMKLLSSVVAFFLWIFAYWMFWTMPFSFPYTIGLALIGMALGNTLIIFAGIDSIIHFVEKRRSRYYKGIQSFTVSQLRKKMTSSSLSLSVVTLVLFIAILIMPMSINLGKEMMINLEQGTLYDVSITVFPNESKNASTLVEEQLEKNDLTINHYFKDYAQIALYTSDDITLPAFDMQKGKSVLMLKLSDYNKMRKLQGLAPTQLEDNEYILNSPQKKFKKIFEKRLQTGKGEFLWQDQQFKPKANTVSTLVPETSNLFSGGGMLIVADHWLHDQQINRYIWNGLYKDNGSTFFHDYREHNINLSMETKEVVTVELTTSNITVSYIGVYVGLTLLLTSLTILSLHILGQEEQSFTNYQILRQLGVSKKKIEKSVLQQQFLYYSLPVGLALLHGLTFNIVSISQFENLTTWSVVKSVILSFILMIGMYSFYFIVTYQYNRRAIDALE